MEGPKKLSPPISHSPTLLSSRLGEIPKSRFTDEVSKVEIELLAKSEKDSALPNVGVSSNIGAAPRLI